MSKVKVMIVDDQQLVREGLASLLILQDGIEVIGTAENGRDGLIAYRELKPDVVLMDIRMPIMDGITAVERILQENSEANILMLTTFDDEEYVLKSLKAGALGYVKKNISLDDLAKAIHMVKNRTFQMEAGVMAKLLNRIDDDKEIDANAIPPEEQTLYETFSDREKKVIKCLAQGFTNREIASEMNLSEGTVKNYVSDLLAIINLPDRTRLALRAFRNGWDK